MILSAELQTGQHSDILRSLGLILLDDKTTTGRLGKGPPRISQIGKIPPIR